MGTHAHACSRENAHTHVNTPCTQACTCMHTHGHAPTYSHTCKPSCMHTHAGFLSSAGRGQWKHAHVCSMAMVLTLGWSHRTWHPSCNPMRHPLQSQGTPMPGSAVVMQPLAWVVGVHGVHKVYEVYGGCMGLMGCMRCMGHTRCVGCMRCMGHMGCIGYTGCMGCTCCMRCTGCTGCMKVHGAHGVHWVHRLHRLYMLHEVHGLHGVHGAHGVHKVHGVQQGAWGASGARVASIARGAGVARGAWGTGGRGSPTGAPRPGLSPLPPALWLHQLSAVGRELLVRAEGDVVAGAGCAPRQRRRAGCHRQAVATPGVPPVPRDLAPAASPGTGCRWPRRWSRGGYRCYGGGCVNLGRGH